MDISSISALHRSTYEERQSNLGYMRGLYGLFSLHLLIALLWSTWVRSNAGLSAWVEKYWWIALVCAIIALLILLACMFANATRQSPINYVCYVLFTLCAAYAIGYLVAKDKSGLVYYTLACLTAIALAFAVYAL